MLVYNPEIFPENHLYFGKSDCTGFTITSAIAMITGVVFGLQQACNAILIFCLLGSSNFHGKLSLYQCINRAILSILPNKALPPKNHILGESVSH